MTLGYRCVIDFDALLIILSISVILRKIVFGGVPGNESSSAITGAAADLRYEGNCRKGPFVINKFVNNFTFSTVFRVLCPVEVTVKKKRIMK